jgi:Flp pilus assembly protein TadD
MELGQLEESEESLRKAIFLQPKLSEAHNNLGNTLQKLDRLVEAEASHREAITLRPKNAEAYADLGGVLKKLGKLKSAETNYKKAILLKPGYARAHNNLGVTLEELGKLEESESSYRKAIALKPEYAKAFWNLSGLAKTIPEADYWISKCLTVDANHEKAKLTNAAIKFYQGNSAEFEALMKSEFRHHSYMRSFAWAFSLPKLPELHFNRFYLFDSIVNQSIRTRPFYEFGVWRGNSFRYLINSLKKGYGFDTFTGLPEDWDIGNGIEKSGTYSSDGNIPSIKGGEFIVGKYEDTLPIFYSKPRPLASVINFDADLYSSTICALNYSRPVIDQNTILIFDEFIMNESWEQDEFRALNEFTSKNNCTYDVIAISFCTKQVAVKLVGI